MGGGAGDSGEGSESGKGSSFAGGWCGRLSRVTAVQWGSSRCSRHTLWTLRRLSMTVHPALKLQRWMGQDGRHEEQLPCRGGSAGPAVADGRENRAPARQLRIARERAKAERGRRERQSSGQPRGVSRPRDPRLPCRPTRPSAHPQVVPTSAPLSPFHPTTHPSASTSLLWCVGAEQCLWSQRHLGEGGCERVRCAPLSLLRSLASSSPAHLLSHLPPHHRPPGWRIFHTRGRRRWRSSPTLSVCLRTRRV